ncbi:MAG: zinc ribbon domain-containing protein [Candidatus Delongbacteria bacterium]|jgi:hypothetical protein|nr:zinc ribbon domain-containing protein [Candidatus Delongbacteria bacterium]
MKNNIVDISEVNIWEERADFIDDSTLLKWTISTSHFQYLASKISMQGALLLVGPRGSGKTHIMRYVFQDCRSNKKKPLPIYVTFGQYFKLEPLITKKANAQIIFHVWVLLKIIKGLKFVESDGIENNITDYLAENDIYFEEIEVFIDNAEKGMYESNGISEKLLEKVTINLVQKLIRLVMENMKRSRCILLLDDAALTLTPEYLIEFFDVVRSIKARDIAPKVSVYPGTTEYGPRFHVQQDAITLDIWKIDDSEQIKLMQEIFNKRLKEKADGINKDIVKIFMFAAFGIPRAFITLVHSYIESDIQNSQRKYNQIIKNQATYLENEYSSIAQKLEQYKDIIDIGKKFFNSIVNNISALNKKLKLTKQVVYGLKKNDSESTLEKRMIQFLIEAGLLYPIGEVSHGTDRVYKRYVPHTLFLLNSKAFSKTRGFNSSEIIKNMNLNSEKHPLRDDIEGLLTKEEIESIKLNLPPCTSCGTSRIAESQKFCHSCGNELVNESKFQKCMKIKIKDLPLTEWRINKITEETELKTIGDIYSHIQPASELQKAKGIGKKRSSDTYEKVLRYIEEFLS